MPGLLHCKGRRGSDGSDIMIKMLGVFRRKPGITPEGYKNYYENEHVPLVLSLSPRFAAYRRNYVIPEIGKPELPHIQPGVPTLKFDGFAEAWFPDQATFDKVGEDLKKPENQALIIKSEENLFDRSQMIFFVTEEHITPAKDLGAGEGAPDDGSMVKMVAFMKRKPGMSREAFKEYYETRHAPLAAKCMRMFAGYRRSYIVPSKTLDAGHVKDRPPQPDVDVLTEIWFRKPEDVQALAKELAHPEIGPMITADEANMLDRTYMKTWMVQECVTSPQELEAAKRKAGTL